GRRRDWQREVLSGSWRWRRSWCGSWRWCRSWGWRGSWRWSWLWGRGCRSQLEASDARAPIKGAVRGIIFVRIPESGVVYWIDNQCAIIAPAIAGAALTASAIEQVGFTLAQRVQGIGREPRGVAELGIYGRTRSAKANREISMPIHGCTSHPAPGRVRLVSALLQDCHRSGGYVAQLEPAHTCYTARIHRIV